ncbi:hypothetical protein BKA63DRAFT_575352 [Paraphoma chrysanthemicola]|nr:hypothetical protein BKA63DRAFT_575352 [Paraphoma chrysanthemicola]
MHAMPSCAAAASSSSRVGSRPTAVARTPPLRPSQMRHAGCWMLDAGRALCSSLSAPHASPPWGPEERARIRPVGKLSWSASALVARSCWLPPHSPCQARERCWWASRNITCAGHHAARTRPCPLCSCAIGYRRRVLAHAQPRRLLHTATHRGE